MDKRHRLDQQLVDRKLAPSRSRARDAVLRGAVTVNGRAATKPGMAISRQDAIGVDDEAGAYVSRAALKLKTALDATGFEARGRIALDLGASTGGFTQVLLDAGAGHVFAVDVGHGQIAEELMQDKRVTVIEGQNARDLLPAHLDNTAPDCVVCDVSFISLKLALPPALELAEPGAWGVFLVKPQFEVGRKNIGKGGLVRDPKAGERCAQELSAWLDQQSGWRKTHLLASPIAGGSGNLEYLLCGKKS